MEKLEQAVGNQGETLGLAANRVAAGMQNDAEQAEGFGAIELVGHRLHRLLTERRVCRREIDQVARMRDDRPQSGGAHSRTKLANLFATERPAAPLAGVLRKDLEGFALVHDGPLHGAWQTAGDRHVGT